MLFVIKIPFLIKLFLLLHEKFLSFHVNHNVLSTQRAFFRGGLLAESI